MAALSKTEIDSLMGECRPHMEELYKTGSVILDAGLDLPARQMQRVKGKVRVTDGPYAESKELVGSAFLIEARDMEQAVELASLHPTTRVAAGEDLGWRLEIRPIDYFATPNPGPLSAGTASSSH
jgi:hypothetical protein